MTRPTAPLAVLTGLCVVGLALTSHVKARSNHDLTFSMIDVPGATFVNALGINPHGDIVGRYTDADGTNHGWLLSDGEFTTIDFPDSAFTGSVDISPDGNIVGIYRSSVDGPFRGFLMQGGEFTSIDVPDADGTSAEGINGRGDIVGGYCDGTITPCPGNGLGNRGYLLRDGEFTAIDVPDATWTLPWKINSRGEIVGIYVDASGTTHGFVTSGDEFTTIDVPGATNTEAYGINSLGDIVGAYCTTDCDPGLIIDHHGFVLHHGRFRLIDFPGAQFTRVFAINPRGDMVGAYRDFANQNHGFLITRDDDEGGPQEQR